MSYNDRYNDRDRERDRDRDRDYNRPSSYSSQQQQQGSSRGGGGGNDGYRGNDPGRSSQLQNYGRGGGGYDDRDYRDGGGRGGYQGSANSGYQDRGTSSANYQDRTSGSASYQDRSGGYTDRNGHSSAASSHHDRGSHSSATSSYQDRSDRVSSSRGGAGICYSFQRGECTRGNACRFSHECSGNGNSNAGRGGGGGFQGRGAGGGFQGRGGGRGGGGNPHMGSVANVTDLLRSASVADTALLTTLCPSTADIQQRAQRVDLANVVLPSQAEWRLENYSGARVNNVKVNHFAVDTRSVPSELFNYSVSIFKFNKRDRIMMSTDRSGAEVPMDLALDGEEKECYFILKTLIDSKPDWQGTAAGQAIGITYDGRKTLFATSSLPGGITDENDDRGMMMDVVHAITAAGSGVHHVITEILEMPVDAPVVGKFMVKLTEAGNNPMLPTGGDITEWRQVSAATIQALDTAPLAFARWGCVDNNSNWLVERSKAFRKDGTRINLSAAYFCMRGYQASLRCSLAGLTLNIDMSVSAFLAGGNLVNIMWRVMGYNSLDDMLHSASSTRGLDPERLNRMKKVYKNAKIKTTHLRQSKKFQDFGPPANHRESEFEMKIDDENGESHLEMITVAQYFSIMNQQNTTRYPLLQYPQLPVVNVGGAKRAVYIPCELIDITEGQTRSKTLDGPMVATMIKEAAVKPDDRMRYLSNQESIIAEIAMDDTAGTFGLAGVSKEPMAMNATLLPPAKLLYGDGQICEPGLAGTWNTGRNKFAELPPSRTGRYRYGVLFVYDRSLPKGWESALDFISRDLEQDSRLRGLKLECTDTDGDIITSSDRELDRHMRYFKKKEFAIVFVIFAEETSYGAIKYAADKEQVMTACMSFKKILKKPSGYAGNVVLKANAKLGGTNHFLASRNGSNGSSSSSSSANNTSNNNHRGNYHDSSNNIDGNEESFQRIPASIGWLFDSPCMLMGIDLSHPDPGQHGSSVAAVVASMDGALSQYKCHISAQTERVDDVACLEDATYALLLAFKACNNNQLPKRIIIFRDGVSESQFLTVVDKEMTAIKGALSLVGDIDSIGVAMVVAQKRHNTRMFYHDKEGSGNYLNACPGVCVDASGRENSITSGLYNEYIINSHAAIQGTAKPCKYTLLYDDIGLKMSELELLTYWSTYMYSRCNKSVSYATPAYYAHWAAKRGKSLLTGGARPDELRSLSQGWLDDKPLERTAMYFI